MFEKSLLNIKHAREVSVSSRLQTNAKRILLGKGKRLNKLRIVLIYAAGMLQIQKKQCQRPVISKMSYVLSYRCC